MEKHLAERDVYYGIMVSLQALGDQAVLLHFAAEDSALRFAEQVRRDAAAWLVDTVPAYASVAIFFDPEQTCFAQVADSLRTIAHACEGVESRSGETKLHRIPCCYELQMDIGRIQEQTGLSLEDVIRLHAGTTYRVYAIGFCPGFPYLGYLPDALSGVPRLPSPRLHVEQGCVGLAGKQTGIYTQPRPGGWNIIGRTPLTLVDVRANYFPLRAGDRVVFERIDEVEYRRLLGRPL